MNNWTNSGIKTAKQLYNGEVEKWSNRVCIIILELELKSGYYIVFVKNGTRITDTKSYSFEALVTARVFMDKVKNKPEHAEQIYRLLCEE